MTYKFSIQDVMKRQEDGIDNAIVIIIGCENDISKAASEATIIAPKAEFAKWPPVQANIETFAKGWLNGKNGQIVRADELKARAKIISDSSMEINKVTLDLEEK